MDRFSEADVKESLQPYHAKIRAMVQRGLDEWLAVSKWRAEAGFAPILYPRTVTNYVFDAIARNARSAFALDATVRVLDEAQTVKFCFGSVVIGRFKKGDDDNLGQNIETQAVLQFIEAEQTLPGLPPEAAKVEFIWAANDIGTELKSVLVVARDGDEVLWSYEIDDEAGTSVVELPLSPASDDDAPLVRPKRIAPAKGSEGK
ncbi:MAG: hypothetical protein JNM89_15785 [Hyphomicrobiaceae bacterium]|nr:hypothetical protein [Hyphomicrobiaceae bacterium]